METEIQAALHQQMTILQDNTKRMNENSRNCKTWCITIVAALLAFSTKSILLPWYVIFVPILPLLFLDMYYLAIEKQIRRKFNNLMDKVNDPNHNLILSDIYGLKISESKISFIMSQWDSFSIWPFYGILALLLEIIGFIMNRQTPSCHF